MQRYINQTSLTVLVGTTLLALVMSVVSIAGGVAGLTVSPILGFGSIWMLIVALYCTRESPVFVWRDSGSRPADAAQIVRARLDPALRARRSMARCVLWGMWGIALCVPIVLIPLSKLQTSLYGLMGGVHILIWMCFLMSATRQCVYAYKVLEESIMLTNSESSQAVEGVIAVHFRRGKCPKAVNVPRVEVRLVRLVVPQRPTGIAAVGQKTIRQQVIHSSDTTLESDLARIRFQCGLSSGDTILSEVRSRRGMLVWSEWRMVALVRLRGAAASTVGFSMPHPS